MQRSLMTTVLLESRRALAAATSTSTSTAMALCTCLVFGCGPIATGNYEEGGVDPSDGEGVELFSGLEVAAPGVEGSAETVWIYEPWGPEEVEVRVLPDGEMVIGDRIVSPHELLTEEEVDAISIGDETVLKGLATTRSNRLWPGGVIPYRNSHPNPIVAEHIAWAAEQLRKPEYGLNIRLVPRTNQGHYVDFIEGPGCASSVGRVGGRQSIWLAPGGRCGKGSTLHEVLHALGIMHEQCRFDRDNYVDILWDNLISRYAYIFRKVTFGYRDVGTYDYGSIMHYPAWAFSSNGEVTIRTTRSTGGVRIGQRNGLSDGDVATLADLYSRRAQCGNGVKEPGEVCDDGANNGKPGKCNNSCSGWVGQRCERWCATHKNRKTKQPTTWEKRCTWDACGACSACDAQCGNGVKEPGEVCDDGANNGKPGKCNNSCSGWVGQKCERWCATHKSRRTGQPTTWELRCTWDDCGGCDPCSR